MACVSFQNSVLCNLVHFSEWLYCHKSVFWNLLVARSVHQTEWSYTGLLELGSDGFCTSVRISTQQCFRLLESGSFISSVLVVMFTPPWLWSCLATLSWFPSEICAIIIPSRSIFTRNFYAVTRLCCWYQKAIYRNISFDEYTTRINRLLSNLLRDISCGCCVMFTST